MRYLLLFFVASAAFAQGQDLKTPISYARAVQNQIKSLVQRSAEKMPDDQYSFKPTPQVRSFGEILGHIADAQYLFCSAVLGEKNPTPEVEKNKHTKAELSAALRDAFSYCDKAYNSVTEKNAAETVQMFGSERAKMGVLSFNSTHSYEHYGNLVTYMRIKGIVPPSSERQN